MARNALLVRLLAAVGAIAAIALAAATLETPTETSGGDSGVGDGGNGEGIPPEPPQEGPLPPDGADIPFILEALFYAIVIVLAVAFVWYLIAYRREAVKAIAAALVVVLAISALVSVFMGSPAIEPDPPEPVEPPNESVGGGDVGSGEGESFSLRPLVVLLSLVTVIFVGGLLVSRRSGESGSTAAATVVDEEPDDHTDAAAVGSVAGQAADRIDDGSGPDVDNEIYRAWREMTDLLEVDRPESSTPREFASAAVDAGLERDHVDELTRLFEDVRYGGAETTAEMETRAVEVLRRIETAYATDGTEPADSANSSTVDSSDDDDAGPGGDGQ